MATAWQRKFGDTVKSCATKIKHKLQRGESIGGKSILKAIGDCTGSALRGKGKGSSKRKHRRSRKHRKTRRARR